MGRVMGLVTSASKVKNLGCNGSSQSCRWCHSDGACPDLLGRCRPARDSEQSCQTVRDGGRQVLVKEFVGTFALTCTYWLQILVLHVICSVVWKLLIHFQSVATILLWSTSSRTQGQIFEGNFSSEHYSFMILDVAALFSNWNFLGSPPLSGCSAKTFLP